MRVKVNETLEQLAFKHNLKNERREPQLKSRKQTKLLQ